MKRRGFTLIELMVVIAIIIILAAIAIPNYLKMTERAKRSRIASDMATLATGLETFRTDWGAYPLNATAGTAEAVDVKTTVVHMELAGLDHATGRNIADATNAAGEKNPHTWAAATPFIEYLKTGTLQSIVDPFGTGTAPADGKIYYLASTNGNHWVLFAYSSGATATGKYLYRSDSSSTVVEQTKGTTAIADDTGVVTP